MTYIASLGVTKGMGFSMSWAAVRGGTPQAVHDALALRGTGTREEIAESDITGAMLPGGWGTTGDGRTRKAFGTKCARSAPFTRE